MDKYKINCIYSEDDCHNNYSITIESDNETAIFENEINDFTIDDKL